ncbi:lipoprotein-releasing ABC transporter permease subunit [Kordiimonas sp. SCSIO 12610]|uniref:lipoprotein-releasing ABC transporter permease subunit n=1 Tax=Kordiimonas sp. SCSIO 12610 TaxID=2829597 RepID=UPI00210B141E|nr:lipoprotein-releasing ABC transporter permease subunit [Kordiimonas sp. SCSIO 12610]UTW54060.1 lipoprotein-releasing ABC transporter permease subunit [Kordiimonas sp. SCSIO 12610]
MIARGYEWRIAKRYLTSRRKDGFISLTAILSMVAIALGVGTLLIVMSVMNGFRAELLDSVLGYHGHVIVQGYGGEIKGYEELRSDLKKVDGVTKVIPFVEKQVLVTHDQQSRGALVRGLPDDVFTEGKLNINNVLQGDLRLTSEVGGVVLGYQLARTLGVGVGDNVKILSPTSVATPFGSAPRSKAYPVVAIIEIGVYAFDESFIGMALGDAQRFFRLKGKVNNFELFLNNPNDVDQYFEGIREVVGSGLYVSSWKSFNQSLVGALQTERIIMFIVVGLIIVVAVFNVSSSLLMLVKDKSADIAILRTMGAERDAVSRVFTTVGLVVGGLGIVIGCLLAAIFITYLDTIKSGIEALFGLNLWDPSVRFITEMKAEVDWVEAVLTVVLAVILSLLATIIPARRAASLDPVDVLRYE